jgi:hypothetical protein
MPESLFDSPELGLPIMDCYMEGPMYEVESGEREREREMPLRPCVTLSDACFERTERHGFESGWHSNLAMTRKALSLLVHYFRPSIHMISNSTKYPQPPSFGSTTVNINSLQT